MLLLGLFAAPLAGCGGRVEYALGAAREGARIPGSAGSASPHEGSGEPATPTTTAAGPVGASGSAVGAPGSVDGGPAGLPPASEVSASVGGAAAAPTVLASNIYNVREIAVDDANVYFTALSTNSDNDGVYQIAKDASGAAAVLLSSSDRQPLSLSSDGAFVYWGGLIDPTAIRRVAVGGHEAATLADVGVAGLALGPTRVFFVTEKGVQSLPKGGGAPTVLASQPSGAALGVAVDASHFYFALAGSSGGSTLYGVAQSGGPVTTLAALDAKVNALATDGANVYFVAGDALSAVSTSGGPVSVLAGGFAGTTSFAVDSAHVYAAVATGSGTDGAIVRVPVAGGSPTVLAAAQWLPQHVAVDANFVYWTNFSGPVSGAILRAPK